MIYHLCPLLTPAELLHLARTCRAFRSTLLGREAWQHQVLRWLPAQSQSAPSHAALPPSRRPLLPLIRHLHLHGNRFMLPAEYRLVSSLPLLTSLSLRGYIHPGGVMLGVDTPEADQQTVDDWSGRQGGSMFEGIHDDRWYRIHSPLLLCLHQLRRSLRYLDMQGVDLDGAVMEDCSAMPNLQVLRLGRERQPWAEYSYRCLASAFPSLTSLSLTAASMSVVQLVGSLALLEEVHWPESELWAEKTAQLVSGCAHIRALDFAEALSGQPPSPPPASFAAFCRLPLLVRLTLDARHLCEAQCEALFSSAGLRLPFLRCLELRPAFVLQRHIAPQTDAALRFVVVPPHLAPQGRAGRQLERARGRRKRRLNDGPNWGVAHPEVPAAAEPWWEALYAAHCQSSFPFPALECLDLPYSLYSVTRRGPEFEGSSRVSARMVAELRRSYEWERLEDWQAETTTLGAAEWKKAHVVQTW